MIKLLPLIFCLIGGTQSIYANDLEDALGSVYKGMVNVTTPNIDGISRGEISGGSIQARARIIQPTLISFSPPSAAAGCGGIDMYGGALSFIGKDEFENFLRAIAANATGYAFQLALGAMCPDCRHLMNDLQKKVQKLNELMANSCQVAQGLINDALGPMENKARTNASMMNTYQGVGDAFQNLYKSVSYNPYDPDYDSTTGTRKKGDLKDVFTTANAPPCSLQGNFIWCGILTAPPTVVAGGGTGTDKDFAEALMTLVGTVIAQERAPATNDNTGVDASENSTPIIIIPGTLGIEDLIEGGEKVRILNCDDDSSKEKCLKPEFVDVELEGLKTTVMKQLLGDGTIVGVIQKYEDGDVALSDDQKKLMAGLGPAGAMITRLSTHPKVAKAFVIQAAPQFAFQYANTLIDEMLTAVASATGSNDSPYRSEVIKVITESRMRINTEAIKLQSRYGSMKETVEFYNNLAVNLKLENYYPQQQ